MISGLWQDSAILWRRARYDPETFAVDWECVALDGVTVVCVTAADGADRSEDRCVVYIKEGTSLIDGAVYGGISRGEPLCAPGDRLLPLPAQYTASLPANGAYRIESVETRTQGTGGVRHTKLTAR